MISVFQDVEGYLRTKRVSQRSIEENFKKKTSRFVNFEMPPGIYEMIDTTNTLNESVNINVVSDYVTMETSLNTKNILRYDEKSFF